MSVLMHRFILWKTVFGDIVHHKFQTQVFFQIMHKIMYWIPCITLIIFQWLIVEVNNRWTHKILSVNRRRGCSIRTRAAVFCSRRLCCQSFCIIVWLWQNQRIKRMTYRKSSTLTLHCQSLWLRWVFWSRIRHLTVISVFFGTIHKQYHDFKIHVFWYVMPCCWASSLWHLEDSTILWNPGNN
jgi:hypothetical protein